MRQDPAPGAAVLQGLFFGRIAPHRTERRTLQTETLVIGHRRDPLHPFTDAGMLAEELPNARLLEASSIIELRVAPKRLTAEIAAFIDECWRPRPAERAGPARKRASAPWRSAARRPSARRAWPRRRRVVAGDRIGDAVADVAVEDPHRDLLERGLDGRDLGEDVDAVGVLADHALEPADLALDASQAVLDGFGIGLHGI